MNANTNTTAAAAAATLDDEGFVEVDDFPPPATPAEIAALAAQAEALAEEACRIDDTASDAAVRRERLSDDAQFALGALSDGKLAVCVASGATHQAAEQLDESTARRELSVARGAYKRVKEAERRVFAAFAADPV